MNENNYKHVCAVTIRSYPFGGGEDFCKDILIWCVQRHYRASWLCFAEGRNLEPIRQRSEVEIAPGVNMILLPGGFSAFSLQKELKLLNPTVVTTFGMQSLEIIRACKQIHIKTVAGWHFWTDAVDLNCETSNTDIMANASKHKVAQNFDNIRKEADVVYVCSEFLQQAFQTITNVTIPRILHPLPSPLKLITELYVVQERTAVVAFNLHPLKSGLAFEFCARANPHIPFIGCFTENGGYLWEMKLCKLMDEAKNVTIVRWESDTRILLRKARLVLVTSQVDETFCRVAAECKMSGIPVIATQSGNLPNLLGAAAQYVSKDLKETDAVLKSLYNDEHRLTQMSKTFLQSSKHLVPQFDNTLHVLLDDVSNKEHKRVMFFTIWGEQGLGYQCLAYVRALESIGIQTCVFSFCSYLKEKSINYLLQTNPLEWLHGRVYYSRNTRERVSDEELKAFVATYNVGTCVIPETCWFRVFEIADLMRSLQVRTIGVPNIEIVRHDELEKHRKFDRLWANNTQCAETLAEYALETSFVGFSPAHIASNHVARLPPTNVLRLLLVCGWNGQRKGLNLVVEAFLRAYSQNDRMSLTVTAQAESAVAFFENREMWRQHKAINVLIGDMSHEELLTLYSKHDAVVVMSHNEGLGLSLYEPLALNTPVIALDCKPHNEVVRHLVNGFLVHVQRQQSIHVNPQAIVRANIVDELDLANTFLLLAQWTSEQWAQLSYTLREDFQQRFSFSKFANTLAHRLKFEEEREINPVVAFDEVKQTLVEQQGKSSYSSCVASSTSASSLPVAESSAKSSDIILSANTVMQPTTVAASAVQKRMPMQRSYKRRYSRNQQTVEQLMANLSHKRIVQNRTFR